MKIFLDSVGCRLNQSEIDRFAHEILAAGHDVVFTPGEADLTIINTCAVTTSAASTSRQKSRRAARDGTGGIVLTGCWASLYPERAALLPKVETVIGNNAKDQLVSDLLGSETIPETASRAIAGRIQGGTLRTRAFIKVQDGCDCRCTFCVTTLARGKSRSRSIEQILELVQEALEEDRKEIVLTGVQLGAWGLDLRPRLHLADLIRAILSSTAVPRLRLSSIEPWNLDAGFFELWQDDRLCAHLHLPLQSGSDRILQLMNRRTSLEAFRTLANQARRAIPDLALTTDLIVGFPGESVTDFEQSLDFVRELQFAGGHVFSYSPRPGTRAAIMPGRVAQSQLHERSARMRAVLNAGERCFKQSQIGTVAEVLWEGSATRRRNGWQLRGWSRNHLPIQAIAPSTRTNLTDRVRLTTLDGDSLWGEILTSNDS